MEKVVSLEERRERRRRNTPVRHEVRYKQTFDYTMIVTLVVLVCFGLVMVYSSSYYCLLYTSIQKSLAF